MHKKGIVIVLGLAVIIAIAVFFAYGEVSIAQDCRLVMIHSGEDDVADKIVIEPITVWASKETCVIWSNWLRARQVKVMFNEGKKIETATEAARGFVLDAANAYLSNWMPKGGIASLKFDEEGTFQYVVEDQNGLQAKGEIIIR